MGLGIKPGVNFTAWRKKWVKISEPTSGQNMKSVPVNVAFLGGTVGIAAMVLVFIQNLG